MSTTPVDWGTRGLDATLSSQLDARFARPRETDTDLIARVKNCVMASIRAETDPGHRTVRAHDDAWELLMPGIARKILWANGAASSWMVRLAPGAMFPAHLHAMDEECVVLEGSLCIGDVQLSAGDFHVGRLGSMHGMTRTDTGALVYLRGALSEHA